MRKNAWGSAELAEYESIIDATLAHDVSNSERAEMFADEIERAADQAHRPWAQEVQAEAKRRGYKSIHRAEIRKGEVLVRIDGLDVEKPAMVSVPKTDEGGAAFQQLAFYQVLTREQIAYKRREYIKARKAYDSNIALMDKLTAMLDAAEADDLETAAAILGVSVESWLGRDAA